VYKCFPPAVTTDKDGKPMHSWRVMILPFVEQKPLYDMYNRKEPWDSPTNRGVTAISFPVYRCPSDNGPPLETNYVMITGPNTIGGKPNEAVKMADITDGPGHSLGGAARSFRRRVHCPGRLADREGRGQWPSRWFSGGFCRRQHPIHQLQHRSGNA
jgi:hypothetical protein